MGKQIKSQWDFGELFPPEQPRAHDDSEASAPARKVLTVSELTAQVRRLLENQVGQIWVTGEVTNLRAQSSGHIYFTLKDAGSQLSCVLFRGEAAAHRELLADGRKVLLQGDVTVYEARGQYQIIVRSVELQGVGVLQIAFEKLKQKLAGEGLFAPERKRPLPKYSQRIGLVTSPTGAAIRDVLHVIRRRDPGLDVVLVPCRVQGEGAAAEIAAGIQRLNEFKVQNPGIEIDLILITRGGGSLEDLWAFNEEVVARAIFESTIPVVSAVGHEIDFTISDFVADVRAATPSAAAEIITEGVFSSREFVADAKRRIRQLVAQQFENKAGELGQMKDRLLRVHPRRRLNEFIQRLDDATNGLNRRARSGLRQQQMGCLNLLERFQRVRPSQSLQRRRDRVDANRKRLIGVARAQTMNAKSRFSALEIRLRLLGPEQVLARGYSITTDAVTGKALREADELKAGQEMKTRLKNGVVLSRVEK